MSAVSATSALSFPSGSLTIWSNARLKPNTVTWLRDKVAPHRLVLAARDQPQADWPSENADIAFGQPNAERCMSLRRVQWIHLDSAGYTAFDQPNVRDALRSRNARLSTSSAVYSEPCAQHVLACMLSEARQLGRALSHQLTDRHWAQASNRQTASLLEGQSVLLVGFGSIGRRLTELLAPFHLEVIGLRRRLHSDEPIPMIGLGELNETLARVDHVVDLLPAAEATIGFFDQARFAAMKAGAVFYNIGRGSTVDQNALMDTLRANRLKAAYLDVTDPEPLPPDHPLWTTRGCIITPHAGGGHQNEDERLARHFLVNFTRSLAGEPLLDQVLR
jgi:phosphoglycerate dehydrogenase-like enzyme